VDEFEIVLTFAIGDKSKVRVALLAILSDDEGIVAVIGLKKGLGVVVRVCRSIMLAHILC
jgi:hypothetical protein